NHERVIEILCGRARDAFAHGVRHHQLRWGRSPGKWDLLGTGAHGWLPRFPKSFPMAARATKASLRGLGIEGRFPRTEKSCFSIALRISRPPRLKRSRSMASSRSTFLIKGRPWRNQSRARSTSNFIRSWKAGLLRL